MDHNDAVASNTSAACALIVKGLSFIYGQIPNHWESNEEFIMLIGVSGLVAGDCRHISSETLKTASGLGFKTLQIRVDNPTVISNTHINRLKGMYKDAGFAMGQTVGNYGGGLVSPDEKERARAIKFVKRMINLTVKLDSPNTYLRPGSLNPRGPWLPYSGNWSAGVFDRLVDSTRQICTVAENEGVMLATEGGVACPISSPQRMHDFIQAVGSTALGFNMDPVNFIGSFEDAYNNAALIQEFYDLIGERIVGAHAKDFTVVEGLLPYIKETIIGSEDAMLDQVVFLQGMQRVAPKAHILIEHLLDKDIPAASEGLKRAAAIAEVKFT